MRAAHTRPTLAAIRKWPPTVSPAQAAPALGISRRAMYAAIAAGRCPVRVIRVGGRLHVVTASLVAVLSAEPPPDAA
jgi:hypothetical protein